MRCIAFISSVCEMGLTAAEMVSNPEHTLHKRKAGVCVHAILLHSDVSPPCTLLLLLLQQFTILPSYWQSWLKGHGHAGCRRRMQPGHLGMSRLGPCRTCAVAGSSSTRSTLHSCSAQLHITCTTQDTCKCQKSKQNASADAWAGPSYSTVLHLTALFEDLSLPAQ